MHCMVKMNSGTHPHTLFVRKFEDFPQKLFQHTILYQQTWNVSVTQNRPSTAIIVLSTALKNNGVFWQTKQYERWGRCGPATGDVVQRGESALHHGPGRSEIVTSAYVFMSTCVWHLWVYNKFNAFVFLPNKFLFSIKIRHHNSAPLTQYLFWHNRYLRTHTAHTDNKPWGVKLVWSIP